MVVERGRFLLEWFQSDYLFPIANDDLGNRTSPIRADVQALGMLQDELSVLTTSYTRTDNNVYNTPKIICSSIWCQLQNVFCCIESKTRVQGTATNTISQWNVCKSPGRTCFMRAQVIYNGLWGASNWQLNKLTQLCSHKNAGTAKHVEVSSHTIHTWGISCRGVCTREVSKTGLSFRGQHGGAGKVGNVLQLARQTGITGPNQPLICFMRLNGHQWCWQLVKYDVQHTVMPMLHNNDQ